MHRFPSLFNGSRRLLILALAFSFGALSRAPASPEGTGGESHLQVSRGFQALDRFNLDPAVFIGGLLALADGGLVFYDGTSVVLYEEGDPTPSVLFTPDNPPSFGNFLRLGPRGKSIYYGENHPGASELPHDIFRISLDPDSPGAELVDTLPFNFDLAFDDEGRGFISATVGFENRIFLLDNAPETPNDPVVVEIPGYSGPVAFHDGRLYYCTAILEAGKNRIVYFTSEQLEEGIGEGKQIDFQRALDEGQVVSDGINNYFNLMFAGDQLFGTGGTGIDRILADGSINPFATIFVESGGFASATFLAFRPGGKEFGSGVGPEGGALYTIISDYTSFNDIVEVRPRLFFRRGHINREPGLNLTDVLELIGYLFLGEAAFDPLAAGDVNDDGVLDITDPIYLLNYLYLGGPRPPEPFQEEGPDPTP